MAENTQCAETTKSGTSKKEHAENQVLKFEMKAMLVNKNGRIKRKPVYR